MKINGIILIFNVGVFVKFWVFIPKFGKTIDDFENLPPKYHQEPHFDLNGIMQKATIHQISVWEYSRLSIIRS